MTFLSLPSSLHMFFLVLLPCINFFLASPPRTPPIIFQMVRPTKCNSFLYLHMFVHLHENLLCSGTRNFRAYSCKAHFCHTHSVSLHTRQYLKFDKTVISSTSLLVQRLINDIEHSLSNRYHYHA